MLKPHKLCKYGSSPHNTSHYTTDIITIQTFILILFSCIGLECFAQWENFYSEWILIDFNVFEASNGSLQKYTIYWYAELFSSHLMRKTFPSAKCFQWKCHHKMENMFCFIDVFNLSEFFIVFYILKVIGLNTYRVCPTLRSLNICERRQVNLLLLRFSLLFMFLFWNSPKGRVVRRFPFNKLLQKKIHYKNYTVNYGVTLWVGSKYGTFIFNFPKLSKDVFWQKLKLKFMEVKIKLKFMEVKIEMPVRNICNKPHTIHFYILPTYKFCDTLKLENTPDWRVVSLLSFRLKSLDIVRLLKSPALGSIGKRLLFKKLSKYLIIFLISIFLL